MKAFTITHSTALAVGIAILLVASTVGGGATFHTEPSSTVERTTPAAADGAVALQNESDNASTVPSNQTIEAIRTAENRTNGTVVGARLRGVGDGELQRSTFVYQFDALAANGTLLTVEVYAENATVISTTQANESGDILGDLFGSNDGVPDEARNTSSLRSAAEAVRLAVNQTESDPANQTVTEVKLGTRNDSLVYTVTLFAPGGKPREIVVAANNGTDGIVTTDPQSARTGP